VTYCNNDALVGATTALTGMYAESKDRTGTNCNGNSSSSESNSDDSGNHSSDGDNSDDADDNSEEDESNSNNNKHGSKRKAVQKSTEARARRALTGPFIVKLKKDMQGKLRKYMQSNACNSSYSCCAPDVS
jgi:hypothetical protein